jgi:hypothetical protein
MPAMAKTAAIMIAKPSLIIMKKRQKKSPEGGGLIYTFGFADLIVSLLI